MAARSAVPSLDELEQICGGEGRQAGEPRDFRRSYARFVRRLSIRITWLALHTRLSANQMTVLGILVGIAGALLLGWNEFWPLVIGLVLLQLSFVLDYSDGEIARYRALEEGRQTDAGGAYLDWIGHYYVPAIAIAALAWGVYTSSHDAWVLFAALIVVLSMVRVPYSARDHVLLGLYRDKPELRGSPEFLRAVLARQGGNPELVDLDASYEQRRAGVSGTGFRWARWTNLGQVLVFPGFVNLLTLAVVGDLLVGGLEGQYPTIHQVAARSVLIALLGVVHLVHQVRAASQGHEILRRLR
jgi:phosphatidylglycerophosphate synthase